MHTSFSSHPCLLPGWFYQQQLHQTVAALEVKLQVMIFLNLVYNPLSWKLFDSENTSGHQTLLSSGSCPHEVCLNLYMKRTYIEATRKWAFGEPHRNFSLEEFSGFCIFLCPASWPKFIVDFTGSVREQLAGSLLVPVEGFSDPY